MEQKLFAAREMDENRLPVAEIRLRVVPSEIAHILSVFTRVPSGKVGKEKGGGGAEKACTSMTYVRENRKCRNGLIDRWWREGLFN